MRALEKVKHVCTNTLFKTAFFSSQSQKMNCLNWVDELNASIWRKKTKQVCTKMLNLFDADSFKNDTFISAVYAKRYRVTVQCSTFIV